VTIWQDKARGKNLADVVLFLVEHGVPQVHFTLSGFKESQVVATEAMKRLCGTDNVRFNVSFNLLGRQSERSYLKKMSHTFRTIFESDGVKNFGSIIPMAESPDNKAYTLSKLAQMLGEFCDGAVFDHLYQTALDEMRCPPGPAYFVPLELADNPSNRVTSCLHYIKTKLSPEDLTGSISVSGSYPEKTSRLNMRPNGDFIPACMCPDKRFTKLGNGHENTAAQIVKAHQEFLELHAQRLSLTRATNACKLHRYSPIRISPKRSPKPLLVRC